MTESPLDSTELAEIIDGPPLPLRVSKAAPVTPAGVPPRILLPLIVACALFMENLDSTVLSTSLPVIARDFGESPITLKLALTSYILSLAIFLPASGWMADRFGARLIFRLAIATFMAGSICCGLSHSIPELVAARVLQGLGGAMMVPVGRLVILRSVPKNELVGSLSWLTVPALIGPVLGPPVGGFITTYFEWRWIFWINIPIGVIGLLLATLFIPDIRGEERVEFDTRGFLITGIGLATLVTASTSLGLNVLPWPEVVALFAIGSLLLAGYIRHSRRASNAILDLSLFRLQSFRCAAIGGLLTRIGVGASPFLLPLMLQLGFGMTPFESGSVTFASALGALTLKFLAPPILRRFGFRTVLIWNGVVTGLSVAMPAAFTASTPVAFMLLALLIGGFFRSLQFTATNALYFADVPLSQMSRATTLTSVIQQTSLSLGITIGALVLEATIGKSTEMHPSDFVPAFLVIGAIGAMSIFSYFPLPRNAGQEVSGHRGPARPDPVTIARQR